MIAALMFAAALSGSNPAVIRTTQITDAQLAEVYAFQRILEPMAQEMRNAISAAGDDTDRRKADLDAIEASYQAQVEVFATKMVAWLERGDGFGLDAFRTILIPDARARVSTIRAQLEADPSANVQF